MTTPRTAPLAPPPPRPLPWSVDRSAAHAVVANASPGPLETVVAHISDGRSPAESEPWGLMLPGEASEMCLCAFNPGSVSVTLSWRWPGDEREFVWRFVL